MPKEDGIQTQGKVLKNLTNATFRVESENGHTVLGHIFREMRENYIKILHDDKVTVEMAPYDLTRAHIGFRSKL